MNVSEPSSSVRRRLVALAPIVVGILTGLCSVAVYHQYTRWLPPLHIDETGHALPAASMAFHLRHGAIGAFVADTERQLVWPFFHPWVLSAFFLAFGVSTQVARVSSLALLTAAVMVTCLLARELSRDAPTAGQSVPAPPPVHGFWGGIPSALLMIVTPGFWVHSSRVMIEPLGMLLTASCLLVHAKALRRQSDSHFLLVGLLAALTFLTKYNYGIPLVAALVLGIAIARPPVRPTRRQSFTLLGAFAVPIAIWLAYPLLEKLMALYGFGLNRDEGLSGLRNAFFYPVTVAAEVSWPVTVWLFLALFLSLHRIRTASVSVSFLYVVLSLAMITAHPNKQTRYVFTLLPVLYVLAETELRRLAQRWLPSVGRAIFWPVILTALAVSLDPRPALRADLREAERLRGATVIVDYIVSGLRTEGRTLVLGSRALLPHLLLRWEVVTRSDVADAAIDTLPFPDSGVSYSRYRRGYPPEMSAAYDQRLAEALRSGNYEKVVTVEFGEDSPLAPDWLRRWDAWAQNYVVAMERQTSYRLAAERAFPEQDARVCFYTKP